VVPDPVTSDELRELQRPIKDRYGDDPDSAQITLEADGTLDEDIACSVQTGRALVKAGLHPGTGGDGTLAVDKEASVGFKDIRLRFELQSDASDEELETLQRLTERYCVVFQTLDSSPSMSVSLERS
jgi:hypothetical protein